MKERDPEGFSDYSFNNETNQVSKQIMSVYNSGVVIPSAELNGYEQEVEKLK